MSSPLRQLLSRAAWAPAAVVILHALVAKTPLRQPLDFPIHFLGGASIAFFLFHALDCFGTLPGITLPFARSLFSFALACTIGLFWEFAELFSDTFFHTHIQKSLHETMSDLIADTTGAVTSLVLIFLARHFTRNRTMQTHPNLRVAAIAAVIFSLLSSGVFAGKKAAAEAGAGYHPAIDPADFSEVINNPYFTLPPGTTYTYKSHEGSEINKVTVTDRTKKVMGVTTRVVLDQVWVNGEKIEETDDWYAQDKEGNVWYFGEDSREYKKGKVASTSGSWEAGVKGAQPGIVMQAHPQPGEPYRQEYLKGEAEDMGQVLSVKETVKVPAGTYENCVKTRDWSAIEAGNIEHKYYSKEAGNVVLETEHGDKKRVELVEVTKTKN